MKHDTAGLRQSYHLGNLRREDLKGDPFAQFTLWFDQALQSGVAEPNAMVLSTATPVGIPSSRVVLLKDFSEQGFTFYTNLRSLKALEIASNPYVALNFFWPALERQVRIEGVAAQVSHDEADHYFRSRPPGHQLGAWTSEQSSVIPSRSWLEERLKACQERYEGKEVPRPEHWGGYRVAPRRIEFWQGRSDRLHDRFRYTATGDGWAIERLSP